MHNSNKHHIYPLLINSGIPNAHDMGKLCGMWGLETIIAFLFHLFKVLNLIQIFKDLHRYRYISRKTHSMERRGVKYNNDVMQNIFEYVHEPFVGAMWMVRESYLV